MKTELAAILIKKASLESDKKANAILGRYGISVSQYKILKYIYSEYKKGVRIVDLERYYSLTHPSTIGLVQYLEEKGFVEYKENPRNKRSRLIYPTDYALGMQAELERAGDVIEQELTQNLTEEEKTLYEHIKNNNLRLEQEKIPQSFVIKTVKGMLT